jgi:5'(3')-deoxyribonucleotidase
MTRLRVGFDLDGVLFDFARSVQEYMRSLGLKCEWKGEDEGAQSWDFYKQWDLSIDEFIEICDDGVDAGYIFRNNVHRGSHYALEMTKAMGHDIIIITDRNFGNPKTNSQKATVEWWEWAGFPDYTELHFSPDKTIVHTDTFVEDKLENYDVLEAAGVDVYLVNRPWNYIEGCTRNRIDGVREYPNAISQLTKSMRYDTMIPMEG